MNRILYHLISTVPYQLISIDGGSLRNAIPRESFAIVVVNSDGYINDVNARAEEIKTELRFQDPDLNVTIEEVDIPGNCMSSADSLAITTAIQAVYNGVFAMSRAIEGLVETSTSLARVAVKDGQFLTQSLQRSSVESAKKDVAYTVGAPFRLMGCEVEHTGEYPGWEPNPTSEIKDVLERVYKGRFGEEPHVTAIHAGLECGIIGERYPGLDMISFGPTIKNPHSPDEKVEIGSVQKFWGFLLEVLENTPAA